MSSARKFQSQVSPHLHGHVLHINTARTQVLKKQVLQSVEKDGDNLAAIYDGVMVEVVILRREVSLRMLVYSLLCLAIASLNFGIISAAEDEEDAIFTAEDEARVSELGSIKEENLNCFLQLDQSLADKWTTRLGLGSDISPDKDSSILINRLKDEAEVPNNRVMVEGLGICIGNLTKKLKNPALQKCMNDLAISELEKEDFISVPELFDHTLPVPYLTFLNIRELAKVLYQNRSWEELSPDETKVFQTAGDYLRMDNSGRDKVFVIDQACEWKNLAALRKVDENLGEMLKEFKRQVVRSISLKVGHAVFIVGDLKPGTWITVYRRWGHVRLQNLKDLESVLNDLESQRFTTEELCGYATTLGNHFAEQELKVLLPERISRLHLTTGDLKDKSKSKEALLCRREATKECENYRKVRNSYEEDLRCLESFGELLSNHILYSIVEKYANIETRITYPEIVCKKNPPPKNIAVGYCRCLGSFCTYRDVGEIRANLYKLVDGVVTRV